MSKELFPVNEIVGAMVLNNASDEVIAELQANGKDALAAHADVALPTGMELQVVSNTNDEIHLALPYYETLETSGIVPMDDEDLDAVAGGEIIFTIMTVLGAIGAAVIGGTGSGLVAVGVGAAVVGGATAAGVVVGSGVIAAGVEGAKYEEEKRKRGQK